MTLISAVFLIVLFLTLVFLFFVFSGILNSKYVLRFSVVKPVEMMIFAISSYIGILFSKNLFSSTVFHSLYFTAIGWFSVYTMFFVLDFTGTHRLKKYIKHLSYLLLSADSVSLCLNCLYYHCFTVSWEQSANGYLFWQIEDDFPLRLHFALVAVFTFIPLLVLLNNAVKAPRIYKGKYIIIFLSYAFVFFTGIVFFELQLPYNISSLLYAMLAFALYFFCALKIPKKLVIDFLESFHKDIDDVIICFDMNDKFLFATGNTSKIFEKNGKLDINRIIEFKKQWKEDFGNVKNFFSDDEIFKCGEKELHYSVEYKELEERKRKIGSYFIFCDRTEEVNLLFKEHYIATHDSLTGIYNREHFFASVDEILKSKPDESYLMIASNIKNFKFINELFGPKTGDKILCTLSEEVRKFAVKGTVFGRISGDKFALFMKESDFVSSFFEEKIKEFEDVIDNSVYKVKLYVGLAKVYDTVTSAMLLYDKALMSIDFISEDFQQRIAYYDSTQMEKLIDEKNAVSDFDKSLASGEFNFYCQPVFSEDDVCTGVSTVIRWNTVKKGVLVPAYFRSMLEKNGFMYKLDLYIWEMIISTIKKWEDEYSLSFPFLIDISPKDFFYVDVAEEIIYLVEKYQIKPEHLIFNISETVVTSNFHSAVDAIFRLHECGIRVCITEFGKGISSLSFIESIHPDFLKLDVSFMNSVDFSERNKTVLEFIFQLANEMGIKIISQYCETKEHKDYMVSVGCSYFQTEETSLPFAPSDFAEKFLKK